MSARSTLRASPAAGILLAALVMMVTTGATATTSGGLLGRATRWLLQETTPTEVPPPAAGGEIPGLEQGSAAGTNLTENATSVTFAADLLKQSGFNFTSVTVFAPNDNAFGALPINFNNVSDFFNSTLAENATTVLLLHVVPGVWTNATLPPGNTTLETLAGINITIDNEPQGIIITVPGTDSSANVVQTDIPFGDNIVHIIDQVLFPWNITTMQQGQNASASATAGAGTIGNEGLGGGGGAAGGTTGAGP